MNDIIKNIEAAQLKESVPSFNVGDTVEYQLRSKRETVRESRFSRVQLSRDRTAALERLSQ